MEPVSSSSLFRVTPDNVLQAHKIMRDAAQRLTDEIGTLQWTLQLDEMGGDPVSGDAAVAFTHRMRGSEDSYLNRAYQFRTQLERGADALRQTALTYGWTDEDVARGFPPGAANA